MSRPDSGPAPWTAPRKDSRASSAPDSTSTARPVACVIWSAASAVLDTLRREAVAKTSRLPKPRLRIMDLYSSSTSQAARTPSGDISPSTT